MMKPEFVQKQLSKIPVKSMVTSFLTGWSQNTHHSLVFLMSFQLVPFQKNGKADRDVAAKGHIPIVREKT